MDDLAKKAAQKAATDATAQAATDAAAHTAAQAALKVAEDAATQAAKAATKAATRKLAAEDALKVAKRGGNNATTEMAQKELDDAIKEVAETAAEAGMKNRALIVAKGDAQTAGEIAIQSADGAVKAAREALSELKIGDIAKSPMTKTAEREALEHTKNYAKILKDPAASAAEKKIMAEIADRSMKKALAGGALDIAEKTLDTAGKEAAKLAFDVQSGLLKRSLSNLERITQTSDDIAEGVTKVERIGNYGIDAKNMMKEGLQIIARNPITTSLLGVTIGVIAAASVLYGFNNGAILQITNKNSSNINPLAIASYQAYNDAQNSQIIVAGGTVPNNTINVEITYKTIRKKFPSDPNAVARRGDTVAFNNVPNNNDSWAVTYVSDTKMLLSMTQSDFDVIINNQTELILQTTFNNQLNFTSTAAGDTLGTVTSAAGNAAGQTAAGVGKGVGTGAAGFLTGLGGGLGLTNNSSPGGIFSSIYKNISTFVGILCCIIMMIVFYDVYEVVAPTKDS